MDNRIEEIKERYTEFIENQVTWLPIPMNREDLTYLLAALAEKDNTIKFKDHLLICEAKRAEQAEANNNALVIDLEVTRKALDRAEAKVRELQDRLKRTVRYLAPLRGKWKRAEAKVREIKARLKRTEDDYQMASKQQRVYLS